MKVQGETILFLLHGSVLKKTTLIEIEIFILFTQTWYHYYGTGLEPKVNLTIWTLLLIMFALGLAIGVVLAVGALLFFQVKL